MPQGAFHEGLTLAGLWKLPVVFICENNQYAMGTSIERQSFLTDMSRRADGVGMARMQFDGFDVESVRENVGRAARFAREGHGPVMVEIVTYRHRGHSMSDPAKYRPEGELEHMKQTSDPLVLAENRLAERGTPAADLARVRAEVDALAQDAWDFAESSPEPDTSKLYDYVYAG